MWDPISIFLCMYILNIGMPESRLSVKEIIQIREEHLINKTISEEVALRKS